MEVLFWITFLAGPAAAVATLAAMIYYHGEYRKAPNPKRNLSTAGYVFSCLAIGFFAFLVGAGLGIAIACPKAGNLCGLVGVFGSGPVVAAFVVILFARSWSANGQKAP